MDISAKWPEWMDVQTTWKHNAAAVIDASKNISD